MKVIIQLPAVTRRLILTMNQMFVILFLGLLLPTTVRGQGPLSPSYMPSMDTNPADYPSNIWITDTMTKVRQDAGSPGTQHWGIFYGTQNEFADFQVHVQAPAGGYSALTVTASDFVQTSPSSYTISSTTGISEKIIVYREAYTNVTQVTATSATYYDATGYYPDPLIPTVDPYYGQATNAWPFAVAANQNQSAWVDILIPTGAPSGYYLGSITVKNGSTTLTTMPVILAVWQWPSAQGGYMPSTATLSSYTGLGFPAACDQFYGSYSKCGSYPGATSLSSSDPVDAGVELSTIDFTVMMLDHRYSAASPIYTTASLQAPGSEFKTYWGALLNGTKANTQTLLSGAKLNSANFVTGLNSASAQNWSTLFNTNGWSSKLFLYGPDEPSTSSQWSTILSNATTLHAATPGIPQLITTDLANATANSALNAVDWMVVLINEMDVQGGSLQRSTYNTWLSGSCCGTGSPTRRLWSYQSCSSSGTCSNGTSGGSNVTWPNYDADGKPAANRAQEWLTFLHNQSGELYYDTAYCWLPSNCAGSNPWTSIYAFGGTGDGTLIYPGTSGSVGVSSPIFIPSVRLKHIRDGMQDYEYLHALAVAGQSSLVSTEISSWITNSYTFETTGSGLETARISLGTALHQLTYPVILLPPPSLNGTLN